MEQSCGPAYLGPLEAAIPYMAAKGKVCPQLAEMWGGEECWGQDGQTEDRWRGILNSGCRDGNEIKRIWTKIQLEAQASADWLGEDVPGVLATPVEGIQCMSYQDGGGDVMGTKS